MVIKSAPLKLQTNFVVMTTMHAHTHTHAHSGRQRERDTHGMHTELAQRFGGIICKCIYIEATASVAVMLHAKMHFRAQINRQSEGEGETERERKRGRARESPAESTLY